MAYSRAEILAAYQEPKGPVVMYVKHKPFAKGIENGVSEAALAEYKEGIEKPVIKPGPNHWVIKETRNVFSRLWRDRRVYRRALDHMQNGHWGESQESMPVTPAYIPEDITLIDEKTDIPRTPDTPLLLPWIKDVLKKLVDFEKLLDPKILLEVARILDQARDMADQTKLAPDLIGMSSMPEILEAMRTGAILHIIDALLPELIAQYVRAQIPGKNIAIPNLVKRKHQTHPGKNVELVDQGPLDMNDPFLGELMRFIFELSIAGLTEYVQTANESLPELKGIPPDPEVTRLLKSVKSRQPQTRAYQTFVKYFSIYGMKLIKPALIKYIQDRRPDEEKTFEGSLKRVRKEIGDVLASIVDKSRMSRYKGSSDLDRAFSES